MFIYLQSVVVYFALTLAMFICCVKAKSENRWNYVIFASITYGIIFGLRYGVGADYFSYEDLYNEILNYGSYKFEGSREIVWVWLIKSFASFGVPYWGFNIVISTISIYATFMAFKGRTEYLPFFVLAFMFSCVWLSYSNVVRQALAGSLWIWSLRYAIEKKYKCYFFMVSIATLIHTSSLLLLIIYPIIQLKYNWFGNIRIQLLLLAASLVLMNLEYIKNIVGQVEILMRFTGYDFYADNDYLVNESTAEIGIGFFISLFRNIFFIFVNESVLKWRDDNLYKVSYSIFLLGVYLGYALWGSQIVARIIGYFAYLQPLVAAYVLAFLYKNKRVHYLPVVFAFFIMTFAAILYRGRSNTSLYVFEGQKSLYFEKKQFEH